MGTSDSPSDPRIIANLFQPEQLTRARELRQMTKSALADKVGKSAAAIGQFERGVARPDHKTIAKLALALGFPPSFFARRHICKNLAIEDCHFRSLRSASQCLRRQAIRTGELLHELLTILEQEGVRLPKENISDLQPALSGMAIEPSAASLREWWGLGQGPIQQPIKLVESHGVRVIPLPHSFDEVDAFSFWYNSTPFIMLNMARPPSRIHFDVAHELGHILLHEDVAPGSPDAEKDANDFASAFLMPRATFALECPSRWRFEDFLVLKSRWRTSIAAMVVRANQLGILSTASYRRAFQSLNSWEMRRKEPGEWALSGPSVFAKALALVEGDLPLAALSAKLEVHENHLRELLAEIAIPTS